MTDVELQELSQNVKGIQYKFSKMLLEESKVSTALLSSGPPAYCTS